jgi:hypothetical protein
VRPLTLEELGVESGASPEFVRQFVEVGVIWPLPDGRFDARDGAVLTTRRAILGTATFEPIGRVELKGFAEPVALWRARSADSSRGPQPDPETI